MRQFRRDGIRVAQPLCLGRRLCQLRQHPVVGAMIAQPGVQSRRADFGGNLSASRRREPGEIGDVSARQGHSLGRRAVRRPRHLLQQQVQSLGRVAARGRVANSDQSHQSVDPLFAMIDISRFLAETQFSRGVAAIAERHQPAIGIDDIVTRQTQRRI